MKPVSIFSFPSSIAGVIWKATSGVVGWSTTFSVVLLSAFTAYWVFYALFLPKHHHLKPVHLRFRNHGYSLKYPDGHRSIHRDGDAPEGFPEAIVYLQSEDAKTVGERILTRGQRYRVSLELHVPDCEINKALGMFMTELTFQGKDAKAVAVSSRSALVPFSSPLVAGLGTLFDFFLFHYGLKKESHTLNLVFFEHFVDDSYHPAEKAKIVIYCKDLQVYSAKLHIEAIFTGIRYYMFHWPLMSASFGILLNASIGTILAIWLYFKFCQKPESADSDSDEESFEIDENFAAASTTDNDSTVTGQRQNNDQRGIHETRQQQQAASLPSRTTLNNQRLNRQRHVPVRRLCGPQTNVRRRNVPAAPLSRLVLSAHQTVRKTKDESSQTDMNIGSVDPIPVETKESEFYEAWSDVDPSSKPAATYETGC